MNQESESNPSLNEFKFNVRRPKDCATKFPKDDNKDLVKYNLYFINFQHTHSNSLLKLHFSIKNASKGTFSIIPVICLIPIFYNQPVE